MGSAAGRFFFGVGFGGVGLFPPSFSPLVRLAAGWSVWSAPPSSLSSLEPARFLLRPQRPFKALVKHGLGESVDAVLSFVLSLRWVRIPSTVTLPSSSATFYTVSVCLLD